MTTHILEVAERMAEMDRFYSMMNKHLANFMAEWRSSRNEGKKS